MDDKIFISPQDLWIISTIKFSNSDIKCLEKWVVIKEEMMPVTCPWFRHIVGDGGKKKIGKFDVYEGGFRVPAIFQWKGKIMPAKVSSEIVRSIDFSLSKPLEIRQFFLINIFPRFKPIEIL